VIIDLLLYVGILILTFLIGMPVAFGLGIASIVIIFFEPDILFSSRAIAGWMFYGINNFVILAVPFFLLAGKLMNNSGVTNRIFVFANAVFGHFRGGMGYVNVVASMIFSGMTGSATSDSAGLGRIELKAMKDSGYDDSFAVAITGASSLIGPIIPPSIPLVIYGLLARVSIGRLLLGGVIPGVILGLALMFMVYCFVKKKNYPRGEKRTLKYIGLSFISNFPALMAPLIIVGGIWSGFFTPTEAAIVACVYAIFLSLIYKNFSLSSLWQMIKESAYDSGVIIFIVAVANIYSRVITLSGVGVDLAQGLFSISDNPIVILLVINIAVLIMGCFMETIAALSISVPILMPVVLHFGIDPVQFGVVLVLNLMIGLLTPPFGMVLFVLNRISGIPIDKIYKSIFPFLLAPLVVLILITLFPKLVTWLPGFM